MMDEEGVSPNAWHPDIGFVPLMGAACSGHLDICRLLIERGARTKDELGRSVLPIAAALRSRQANVCAYFLDLGARLDARDHDGNTPLHLAIKNPDLRCVKLLLDAGANLKAVNDCGCEPIRCVWLHSSDWFEILKALVEAGGDPNAKDDEGDTLLHSATRWSDDSSQIHKLIDLGVGTEVQNNKGETPLHRACKSASPNRVLALVSRGVNVEARDVRGFNPLHHACINAPNYRRQEDVDIVATLLKHAPDPKVIMGARDNRGLRPIHVAFQRKNRWLIALLMSWGDHLENDFLEVAGPQLKGLFTLTPLLAAVETKDTQVLAQHLLVCAQPSDEDMNAAIKLSKKRKLGEMTQMLAAHQARSTLQAIRKATNIGGPAATTAAFEFSSAAA